MRQLLCIAELWRLPDLVSPSDAYLQEWKLMQLLLLKLLVQLPKVTSHWMQMITSAASFLQKMLTSHLAAVAEKVSLPDIICRSVIRNAAAPSVKSQHSQ